MTLRSPSSARALAERMAPARDMHEVNSCLGGEKIDYESRPATWILDRGALRRRDRGRGATLERNTGWGGGLCV